MGRREAESAYRSCMALIRIAKPYDRLRFDAACRRALAIGAPTRKSVLAILSRGLDAKWVPRGLDPTPGKKPPEPAEAPRVCPKCKSPYWNRPRKTRKWVRAVNHHGGCGEWDHLVCKGPNSLGEKVDKWRAKRSETVPGDAQ